MCRRILQGDRSIRVTYVVFDVLEHDGEDTMRLPYRERRQLLESLKLSGPPGQQPPCTTMGRSSSIKCANAGSRGSSPSVLTSRTGLGNAGGRR